MGNLFTILLTILKLIGRVVRAFVFCGKKSNQLFHWRSLEWQCSMTGSVKYCSEINRLAVYVKLSMFIKRVLFLSVIHEKNVV